MPFNRVYFMYLGIVVLLPSLLIAAITRSLVWTVLALVGMVALSARPLQFLFHALLRRIGDRSIEAQRNTALRLVLTHPRPERILGRIYPSLDVAPLLTVGREAAASLILLGAEVDANTLDEATARRTALARHGFLDQGNLDWLNARGRIALRRFDKKRAGLDDEV